MKLLEIGKYTQSIKIEDGQIVSASCTCKHGSLYPNNYAEGKTICKHLREGIFGK